MLKSSLTSVLKKVFWAKNYSHLLFTEDGNFHNWMIPTFALDDHWERWYHFTKHWIVYEVCIDSETYKKVLRMSVLLYLFFSGKSAEVYLKPELVGFGCQLVDEIQDVHPPVSFYVYQCIIKCWETGERIVSNSVKLPVSTYTLPDKSLPEFKIALLICQEEYDYQVRNIFGL